MSKVNIYFVVCELKKSAKWATTQNRFINQEITAPHLGEKCMYKV